MEQPLKKRKMLKLYKALKIAYMRNKPKRQARLLKKYGYILDKDLSENDMFIKKIILTQLIKYHTDFYNILSLEELKKII